MATDLTISFMEVPPCNDAHESTVRAGMHNSQMGLSFIVNPTQPPQSRNQRRLEKEKRRAERLESQGACCWRIETIQGLRYRIIADLLCAATLLPGSIAVIILSFGYINSEPSAKEPYPWLKYVMAASGCMLLVLYLAWLVTALCVYRSAATVRPSELDRCRHWNKMNKNSSLYSNCSSDGSTASYNQLQLIAPRTAQNATPNHGVGIVLTPPTEDRQVNDQPLCLEV